MLKALAAGTPVITTGGGATDDFASDPAYALRIASSPSPGSLSDISDLGQELQGWELQPSVDHLEELMNFAAANASWRAAAGAAAAAHAHGAYSWGHVVDTMLAERLWGWRRRPDDGAPPPLKFAAAEA